MSDHQSQPLSTLPKIGPATAGMFNQLGIQTWRDLLYYFPFRYEDYSIIKTIGDLRPGIAVSVKGILEMPDLKVTKFRRMRLTEAWISDESGRAKAVWFNMPYLAKNLRSNMPILVAGAPVLNRGVFEFHNPAFTQTGNSDSFGIIPVYHSSAGLSQRVIRQAVSGIFQRLPIIEDWLPEDIKAHHKLLDLGEALRQIHMPTSMAEMEQARRRLKFDELFLLMLRSTLTRQFFSQATAFAQEFHEADIKSFVSGLPFNLTNDQRKAAWEILKDLGRPQAMNRLLEGDVGSGKTVVAAMAMFNTALNGRQSVLMAPTEVLAKQHIKTLEKLYKSHSALNCALLTGSSSILNGQAVDKKKLQAMIASGEVQIVVGTHALISESMSYKDLALAVIDEQHRFGVEQRKALKSLSRSGLAPHFLSMTATPIPRSLALIIYGELDISLLKEMPAGRKPVHTSFISTNQRNQCYQRIKDQIAQGRQAFVVCPLIDPSDFLGSASVTDEYKKLKTVFAGLAIGLLHGRLSRDEQEQVMADFNNGGTKILISTTVVEVGVDVPNASVMVIEGAERFGLAQLHQLRGRVGRDAHQSYCYLFSSAGAEKASSDRLRFLEKTSDGFALAEYDLGSRGSGEVFGLRQSGLSEFKLASIRDSELILEVRQGIDHFLTSYELDNFPSLKQKLLEEELERHLE